MDFLKIIYTLLRQNTRYFAKGNPTLFFSVHIQQGVTGGTDQTSGGCSLC